MPPKVVRCDGEEETTLWPSSSPCRRASFSRRGVSNFVSRRPRVYRSAECPSPGHLPNRKLLGHDTMPVTLKPLKKAGKYFKQKIVGTRRPRCKIPCQRTPKPFSESDNSSLGSCAENGMSHVVVPASLCDPSLC